MEDFSCIGKQCLCGGEEYAAVAVDLESALFVYGISGKICFFLWKRYGESIYQRIWERSFQAPDLFRQGSQGKISYEAPEKLLCDSGAIVY